MAISAHIESTTRWLITAEGSTKETVCTVEEIPSVSKLLHYKLSNPPLQPEQTLTDVRLFEIGGQQ